MNGVDVELLKYKYNYGAPIPNFGQITDVRLSTNVKMIELHDWRELPNVKQIRQGDTFTQMWNNRSFLRKPITNIMTQGNYIIQGSIESKPDLIKCSIAGGIPIAWDSGLDVSTAPRYGTTLRDAQTNLESKQPRNRMRTEMQDDLVMTEVADIAFDHQRSLRINSTAMKKNLMAYWEQTSGCMTVSNRTVINKVLYTNEDAPEIVLKDVPHILRSNSFTGTL